MKRHLNAKFLLGVDIGTQGAKATLVSADGEFLTEGQCSYSISRPQDGYAEQDPERDWWNGCQKAIAAALCQARVKGEEIIAIGFSAQTPNVVLVDKNGISTRPAIIWQDQRSGQTAAEIQSRLLDAQVWSGQHFPLTAHSYLAPLIWLREKEPRAYRDAFLKLTTPGYFLYRLTGRYAVDPAVASGMIPLFSLEQKGWDRRICDLLSIPVADMPEIIPSHAIAGPLLPKAAKELGLPPGIPVTVGTGDSMADLLSAGVYSPGQVAFTYGTLFGIVRCIPAPVPEAFCFSHAIDHTYLLYSGVPLAGATLRWFRDNFAQPELERAKKTGENLFDLLVGLGEKVPPGCEGLLAFPFNEQSVGGSDLPAGAILAGLSLRHTRGHIYRALIEGIAYETRRQLEGVIESEVKEVTSIGGGSRDTLWIQIVSDVLGIRQRIPAVQHGAPLADAYLAGWGCGLFSNIEQLRNWITPGKIVDSDPNRRLIYQEIYQRYLNLGRLFGNFYLT